MIGPTSAFRELEQAVNKPFPSDRARLDKSMPSCDVAIWGTACRGGHIAMSSAIKGAKSQGRFRRGQTPRGHNVPAPWSMRSGFEEEIGLSGPLRLAASTPIRRHRKQQEGDTVHLDAIERATWPQARH